MGKSCTVAYEQDHVFYRSFDGIRLISRLIGLIGASRGSIRCPGKAVQKSGEGDNIIRVDIVYLQVHELVPGIDKIRGIPETDRLIQLMCLADSGLQDGPFFFGDIAFSVPMGIAFKVIAEQYDLRQRLFAIIFIKLSVELYKGGVGNEERGRGPVAGYYEFQGGVMDQGRV